MARFKSWPWRGKYPARAILIVLMFPIYLIYSASETAQALILPNRSITITTAVPSATVDNDFQFTYASTGVVGSILFEYCDNTPIISMSCTAPAGLDVSGVTLTGQSGNTGFSIYGPGSTANTIVLTRAAVAGSTVPSTYDFSGAVNPSIANHTVFVRISLYTSTDATGAYSDNGSVAFSTTQPLSVNVSVPPFMEICVGISVSANCTTATGSTLDLGILSNTQTRFGTSQFSVGTNSVTGFITYVLGTTLTSGVNTISAINPAATSQIGTNQFGLNLRANTTPAVGSDPTGGTGTPLAGYNTPNQYNLQSGDPIASSVLPTDYTRMTVSYISNIMSGQTPGVYTTTFTYLAVAQF